MAKPVNAKPALSIMMCIFHILYSPFSPATMGDDKLKDNKHSKKFTCELLQSFGSPLLDIHG